MMEVVMEMPKRCYDVSITIGADSLRDVRAVLKSIEFSILENEDRKTLLDNHRCTSGGVSFGYHYELDKTDTKDHDDYFKKIEEWKKAKGE